VRCSPTISQRLNVFYRKFRDECAFAALPAIAVDAANELLTLTHDLDQRLLAAVTIHPSFLSRQSAV